MDDRDPIQFRRETIKIEGGRNLYNYTFEVEDEPVKGDGDSKKAAGKLKADLPEATE